MKVSIKTLYFSKESARSLAISNIDSVMDPVRLTVLKTPAGFCFVIGLVDGEKGTPVHAMQITGSEPEPFFHHKRSSACKPQLSAAGG